jgi:hypothetical protein
MNKKSREFIEAELKKLSLEEVGALFILVNSALAEKKLEAYKLKVKGYGTTKE